MDIRPNVLIPIDFHELSLSALRYGIHIARKLGLEIRLLYIHEEPGILANIFTSEESDNLIQKIREELTALATKAEAESGIKVTAKVRKGKIHARIADSAEEYGSRMIIMGTRSSAEDGNIIGANTSRVIRIAKCPVITISRRHDYGECSSILLPLDLTKETRQKVGWAIEISKRLSCRIRVVSALWSKNDPDIVRLLKTQLAQVQNFIEDAGIHCTAEIIESTEDARTLVPIILGYAKQHPDIDMIIIMTQQEMSVVEYFVGSSAQEIIRKAEVPVMSIIPKELGFTYIA